MTARTSTRATKKPARTIVAPFQSADTAIGTLEPGCRIIGMTKGQFSMLDLLRAVLEQTGPAHVVVSTWTTGIRDAANAKFLIDAGTMLSFRLLTDFSFTTRAKRYCDAVRAAFGDNAIRATITHAKFAVITNDRWTIVIRSSMNLNRNPRFEQFDLDDDPVIAAFFLEHVEEIYREARPGLRASWDETAATFTNALGGGVSDVYKVERPRHGDDEPIDMDALLAAPEPLDLNTDPQGALPFNL